MQNNQLPNANDYELSDEATSTLLKKKVALKLQQSWKITVHLQSILIKHSYLFIPLNDLVRPFKKR